MRIRLHRTGLSAVLVVALLLPMVLHAAAQNVTAPLTEPAETIPATEPTAPPETIPVTEPPAPTEPEETIPPETEPADFTVDPQSAVYKVCDALAQNSQARQIFVYDTNTDKMLYSKSVETGKLFPASTTKLFTTYVALQHLDPNAVITIGDELDLVHEGSSMAYVPRGGKLLARTLVEGMMLPSGNDAAMVLAAAAGRVIAQDETLAAADAVQVFVDEMNRQADELGFEKSHFTIPDGWHSGSHYTCLNDLARISVLALENETIRSYTQLHRDKTVSVSGHYITWENTNLLLNPESGYYRGDTVGLKTGYTRPAGYCLISAFTFEEGEVIVGLFGYPQKFDRYADAIRLANAAREQLRLDAQLQEDIKNNPGVG